MGHYLARPGRLVRACMESTGVYGLDLALALVAHAGIQVMVANPRAVRHFAQALMERNKNDRVDAGVLQEFAARMPFQPWQAPSRPALHLCALARRLEAITDLCAAEKNRFHASTAARALPAIVRQDLKQSVLYHQRAAQRLTREALKVIAKDRHLLAKGKAKMQALVAVERKLLHAIYGMFHHQQPYDGSKVYRLPEAPAAESLAPAHREAV